MERKCYWENHKEDKIFTMWYCVYQYHMLMSSVYKMYCMSVSIYINSAAAKSHRSCPTVQPHRRQPTRLPRPWDSPGKNTVVGCHFLLQCMKVKSESEVAQLCPTLSNPMDCSPPGSSVHGIFQARGLEWVPLPSPQYCLIWHKTLQMLYMLLTLDIKNEHIIIQSL